MDRRKSQSAMEFLMSYGWALLVVLIIIAALAFFGILNPNSFLPEKAEAGTGITVVDSTINEDSVTLLIKNSLGKTLTDFQVNVTDCNTTGSTSTTVTIPAGETQSVTIPCNHSLAIGDRLRSDLKINYSTTTQSTTLSHTSRGIISNNIISGTSSLSGSSRGDSCTGSYTPISACGTISSSGCYWLTTDLTDESGTCFTITASGVTFNGNGSIVDGDDSGTDSGIIASAQTNITIKNFGNVSDFYYGINLDSLTNHSTIANNTVSSNTYAGIEVFSNINNTIENNSASNNVWYGIDISLSSNNSIANNDLTSNSNVGLIMQFGAAGNIVAGNNITSNPTGISLTSVTSSTFSNNTISNSVFDGIWTSSTTYNRFFNNTIVSSGNNGINLGASSVYNNFSDNNVSYNTLDGILFTSSSGNNIFTSTTSCWNSEVDFNCTSGSGNSGSDLTFDSSVTCSGWPTADNSC